MPSWHMYNVDKREMARGLDAKMGEFIYAGHNQIVKLLARPTKPNPKAMPAYYLAASSEKRHELGSLSVIPPELVTHIFSYLSNMDDALCFAAAHRLFAQDGFRRVYRLRRRENSEFGSWAGGRIITVSDEARNLPKGLFTAAEEKEMKGDGLGINFHLSDTYRKAGPPGKRDAWRAAFGPKAHENVMKSALTRVVARTGDYLRVRLLLEDTSIRYALQATWALCNMDRKEYIRADAVANMRINPFDDFQVGSVVEGPFVNGENTILDLGTFAILLTAWSSYGSELSCQWAGAHLRVLEVERLQIKKWKDVSKWAVDKVSHWAMMNDRYLY
ncbi:hypothetical protein PENSPDRAFT_689628 [Peniophora sp. CONT]|nr:hypothetical protein PENSPDRAFT_689628 [Peniophora sp. CONT]